MEDLCVSQLLHAVVLQKDDTLWFLWKMTVVIKTWWETFSAQDTELEAALTKWEPKWATVIVIKSGQDHINRAGHPPDLKNKVWGEKKSFKPKSLGNDSKRCPQTHSRGRTG